MSYASEPLLPLWTPSRKDPQTLLGPAGLEDEFEEWWLEYDPNRRQAKGAARRAYVKARRKVSAATLIVGLRSYRKICQMRATEPGFICHPATWLNGERWQDEYPELDTAGATQLHPSPRGRADALFAAGIAAGALVRDKVLSSRR